jgi:hypothetical protein
MRPSATRCWCPRPRGPHHPSTPLAVSTAGRNYRLHHPAQIASASHPATRLVRLLPAHRAPLLPVGPGPLLPEALPLAPGPSAVRPARLTASSLTARRSLMTRFRVLPTLIQRSAAPCAGPQLPRQTTESSFTSRVAGVPPSTRIGSCVRQSRSTARNRKLPDGSPPPPGLLTCPGTPSTSGPSMPRRGCRSTAPRTGSARSTAANPGTTNCGPKRSVTAARPCTPTRRTIQGCSGDRHARQRTGLNAITTRGEKT